MEGDLNTTILNLRSTVFASSLNISTSFDNVHSSRTAQKNKLYNGIQNGLFIARLQNKYLFLEVCFICVISMVIMLTICYGQSRIYSLTPLSMTILWALTTSNLVLGVVSYMRFKVRNVLAHFRRQTKTKTLQLIIQILLILIGPYPFLQGYSFEEQLPINYMMIIMSLPKIILCYRGLINTFSMYAVPRSFRICQFCSIQNTYTYQIKCIFRDHPLTVSLCLFFTSILYFAYITRIIETGYSNQIFLSFQNCLWSTLMTMTTIGYGDLVAEGGLTKILSIISAFSGVLSVSLLIIWLNNYLSMDNRQERSLIVLKRTMTRIQIRQKAGKVLRYSLWRRWLTYKYGLPIKSTGIQKQAIREFNTVKCQIAGLVEMETGFQTFFQQNIQKIQSIMVKLESNIDGLIEILSSADQFAVTVTNEIAEEKDQNIMSSSTPKEFERILLIKNSSDFQLMKMGSSQQASSVIELPTLNKVNFQQGDIDSC